MKEKIFVSENILCSSVVNMSSIKGLFISVFAIVLICDGIYRKVKVRLRNKSKMTYCVTEGKVYEIKASQGRNANVIKIKYYYYDHISPQEPHMGEYIAYG